MGRVVACLAVVLALVGCAATGAREPHAPTAVGTPVAAGTPETAAPAEGSVSVACLGDSITYGLGVAPTRDTEAWPAVLETLLPEGSEVLNLGVSGATLQDEADLPYRGTGMVDQAIQSHPNVFILMLGTNDSRASNWDAARYEAELGELADQLAEAGETVVLMAPPRCFVEAHGDGFDDAVVGGAVRAAVSRVAQARDLRWIDLYAFTRDHPEWFSDGVHPNAEGNRAIAGHVFDQVW